MNYSVRDFFEEIDACLGVAVPMQHANGKADYVFYCEDGTFCDDITDSKEFTNDDEAYICANNMKDYVKAMVSVYSNANSETYIIDPLAIELDDPVEKLFKLYPNIRKDWPNREEFEANLRKYRK